MLGGQVFVFLVWKNGSTLPEILQNQLQPVPGIQTLSHKCVRWGLNTVKVPPPPPSPFLNHLEPESQPQASVETAALPLSHYQAVNSPFLQD